MCSQFNFFRALSVFEQAACEATTVKSFSATGVTVCLLPPSLLFTLADPSIPLRTRRNAPKSVGRKNGLALFSSTVSSDLAGLCSLVL